MLDWNDLRYLLAVQRAGTLAGAAKRLRVDATTVGRRLEALETSVRAKLVVRSVHGISLTSAGLRVAASAERAESAAMEAERVASGLDQEVPAGKVRVTTLQDIADSLVLPAIVALRERAPLVRVDLWCTARKVDLVAGEADLAIRVGRPTESGLLVRRLCTLVERPWCSAGWLAARGLSPEDVTDLHGREVLLLLIEDRWTEGLGEPRPVLRASTLGTLVEAARAGLGIVLAPEAMARAADLVALPGLDASRERDLWLVLPEALAAVPRIRVVADAIERALQPIASAD